MYGLSSIVLAAILGGTPIALEPGTWARGPHLEIEWSTPPPDDHDATRRLGERIAAMVAETVDLSSGWVGLAVTEDVSLLFDVRVVTVANSPDPACPDSTNGFAARIGISVRPEIEIGL